MLSGIRRSFNNIFSTNFRKNLLILTSGNAAVQILGILSYPILTRLYPDEVFGQYALFNSVIILVGFAITLRYEMAIPLPKKDSEAQQLKLSTITTAAVIAMLLFLFALGIEFLELYPQLSPFIYFIPLVSFVTSLLQINRYWHLRINKLGRFFKVFIGYRLMYVILAISLSFFWDFQNGLIVSIITSSGIVLIIILVAFPIQGFTHMNWDNSVSILKEYYRFPRFSLPSFLLAHASNQIPIFLLIYFFDQSITGQYSVAFNLLWLPQNMIFLRISESLYQSGINLNKQEIRQLIFRLWKFLVPIMAIVCLTLMTYGESLFGLLFGQEWRLSGRIAQLFSLLMFFSVFYTPISSLINVFNLQHITLRLTLLRFLVIIGAFTVAGLSDNLFLAIWIMVIIGSLSNLFLSHTLLKALKK